jgi:hypothetical protein
VASHYGRFLSYVPHPPTSAVCVWRTHDNSHLYACPIIYTQAWWECVWTRSSTRTNVFRIVFGGARRGGNTPVDAKWVAPHFLPCLFPYNDPPDLVRSLSAFTSRSRLMETNKMHTPTPTPLHWRLWDRFDVQPCHNGIEPLLQTEEDLDDRRSTVTHNRH